MVTQTQQHLPKALLSAVLGLFLLTSAVHPAVLPTSPPTPLNASLTAQTSDSTTRQTHALPSYRPCGDEQKSLCANGGQCMYPQDSEIPYCICKSSFEGPRCMLYSDSSRRLEESHHVVGISIGIIVLVILLAIGIYICIFKRCTSATPLIKSAPSETSV